jgi:DnaJ-class molecular chaperone
MFLCPNSPPIAFSLRLFALPHTRQVIKGEGMPRRKLGGRGDLIVKFDIEFPKGPISSEKLIAAGIMP